MIKDQLSWVWTFLLLKRYLIIHSSYVMFMFRVLLKIHLTIRLRLQVDRLIHELRLSIDYVKFSPMNGMLLSCIHLISLKLSHRDHVLSVYVVRITSLRSLYIHTTTNIFKCIYIQSKGLVTLLYLMTYLLVIILLKDS